MSRVPRSTLLLPPLYLTHFFSLRLPISRYSHPLLSFVRQGPNSPRYYPFLTCIGTSAQAILSVLRFSVRIGLKDRPRQAHCPGASKRPVPPSRNFVFSVSCCAGKLKISPFHTFFAQPACYLSTLLGFSPVLLSSALALCRR